MRYYYPLIVVGAIIGVFSILFLAAFLSIKDKKTAIGFNRKMSDKELIGRLMKYAAPFWRSFSVVGLLMIFSIAYDVLSPLLISDIEKLIQGEFVLSALFARVAVYAGILIFSLVSSYVHSAKDGAENSF